MGCAERLSEAELGDIAAPFLENFVEGPDFDVEVPCFTDTEEPYFDALADFD